MSITSQIPKLRFPEYKTNWDFKKITDITSVKAGGTPSTLKREYWDGEILWMNSGELNFKRIYDVEKRITEKGLKNSSTNLIPKNCILIGLAGQGKTRGTAAINYVELCTNQSIASIYPNQQIFDSEFIYQNLDSRYDELRNLSTGAGGRGGLNLKIIGEFKVPLPNIKEQQKIASFLLSVDKKITLLQQKKELLEQYKKGIMQKIFSQELRFKDKDGKNYPDWEEKELGQIGSVVNGLTYSPKDIDADGVLVLRSSNVQNRVLTFKDNVYVNVDKENFNAVKEDDILICVRNGSKRLIGKNAIINKQNEGVAFGAFMAVYRSDYNRFLFHLFDTDIYKRQVHRNLGATINSINGSDLRKFKVVFPSIEEQTRIADFLSAIDDKIQLVNTQLENTQTFKKGLLQQMFV